jgi:hypothetical protein
LKGKAIYVGTEIATPMEKLWEYTQNPTLHTEWDIRFTEILYLPKEDDAPQRFLYRTKMGFGWEIAGEGEAIGDLYQNSGERVSSLKFWTDNPLSLIRVGRGYWKYTPCGGSIRFETQYDYEPRFGLLGRLLDGYVFRPLMGWATAWSFDALKIWLEKGLHPKQLLRHAVVYWIVCLLFSFVWVYQGVVPKLLAMHPKELYMMHALFGEIANTSLLRVIGICEVLFGLIWLVPFNKRRLFVLHAMMLGILTISAVVADTTSIIHPFNPIVFNISLLATSLIGFLCAHNLPRAANCKRSRRE